MKKKIAAVVFALALVAPAGVASAHNAGNITTPNGTCHNLGNGSKDNGRPDDPEGAPLVPEQNANRLDSTGQLELIEGTGDQYGARFAAGRGETPIEGGEC